MKQPDPHQPSGTKIQMIVDSIFGSIASGELRTGDRINSERDLASEFRVSLGTVQRALSHLEYRGVLKREHGRGSFVRGPGASLDARYVRFRDAAGNELPVHWHMVKQARAKAAKEVSVFFGESVPLVRIVRQVDVNAGQFVLVNHVFMPQTLFDVISAQVSDNTNLREVIARSLALPTLRIEELVGFARMPVDVARLIGCERASLCFRLELRSYSEVNAPVYLQRIYAEPFEGATLVMNTL